MTAEPAGPFSVVRWGRRWSVEDVLEPFRDYPRFDAEWQATALAEQLNTAYRARRRPRSPVPVQQGLFDRDGGGS